MLKQMKTFDKGVLNIAQSDLYKTGSSRNLPVEVLLSLFLLDFQGKA